MEILGASFTIWTFGFLMASFFGLGLSFVLLRSKKKIQDNYPIIFLVLGFSIIILEYVFYWTGHVKLYPYLKFSSNSIYLTFGPCIYLYIRNIGTTKVSFSYLHFLPAFLSFAISLYYYIFSSGYQNMQQFQGDQFIQFLRIIKSPWLALMSFFVYLIVSIDIVKLTLNLRKTEYQKTVYKWVTILLVSFGVFITSYLSYFVLVQFPFFNRQWDYFISLSMAFSIYSIGYFVYKESEIFNGELFANIFLKQKQSSTLSEEIKTELYAKLLDHIKVNERYKDNELRLVSLADEIGIPRHLLSNLINEKSQVNFNQFINNFRLDAAEELLAENTDERIKNIYFDVGFNNKSTFYKAFKQRHNCTPVEYRSKKV